MSPKSLGLITQSFPGEASLDTAVSRALLMRVASGDLPSSLRLYRPDPILAFGRQDAAARGFSAAIEHARNLGFESVIRLAGGRAAVFHEDTIAFGWAIPDHDPYARTFARFRLASELFASALRKIGVDARIGEVPGEYCPGEYTINARNRTKIVGIGQRIVSGAAHIGGVVVVDGADRIRQVLIPVYRALGLDWDPLTSGSVYEETGATFDEVLNAVMSEFESRFEVVGSNLDSETLELARTFEPDHRAGI